MSDPKPQHFLNGCFYEMTFRQADYYKEKIIWENNFSLKTKIAQPAIQDYIASCLEMSCWNGFLAVVLILKPRFKLTFDTEVILADLKFLATAFTRNY